MALGLAAAKSKDELVSRLGDFGAEGAIKNVGVSEVAAFLTNPDMDFVAAAIEALGGMGDEGKWYISAIAPHTGSQSKAVRCAAASALGLFGSASMQHAAALVKGVNDKEEAVRAASIVALGQVGVEDEVSMIAGFLDDQSPVVVAAACQALGLLTATDDSHVARIAKRLDDPVTRYAAVAALADQGDRAVARYAGHIIKTCLQDSDSMTRNVAASALGDAAEAVLQSGVDDIKALLKSDHVGIRCTGALAFGYMGEQALAYAGDVAALLSDSAEDTSEMHLQVGGVAAGTPPTSRRPKCAALAALGMMRAENLARECAKALGDERFEVRLCALECLAQLGDAGRAQSTDIAACLEDNAVFVRAKACEVIGSLKADDAMTSLPEVFGDKAPSARAAALYALASAPHIAESFASEVLKCLGDQFPTVKAAAIAALGNLGHVGHPYASVIAGMLGEEEDAGVRCAACEALGRLGAYGAAFMDEVAYCTEADDPALQAIAAATLELMSDYEQPRIADLSAMVGDVE